MKEVLYKNEAREKLLAGAKRANDTVGITMGGKGQTVIIHTTDRLPFATKDGVTVIRYVTATDDYELAGLQLLQEAAVATNAKVGDATTSTTVLAYNLLKNGNNVLNNNSEIAPVFFKRGIDIAMNRVIKRLQEMAVKTFKPFDIAKISANGDEVVAKHIAEAFELVGEEGIINIKKSATNETYIEREEGMRFDNGLVSPVFINKEEQNVAEFGECSVLLVDGDILQADFVKYHAVAAERRGLPLVVIANTIGGETVEMLGRLKMKGLRCAIVKSPLFGTNRTILMKDLAKMTGAKIIGDNYGNLAHLGASGKDNEARFNAAGQTHGTLKGFKSGIDSTLLVYDIDEKYIDNINKNDDDFSKERVAMLNSGIATIFVGGNSDVEVEEVVHRVDDAVNATRAALSDGVVAGGGLALLKAGEVLSDLELSNTDEQLGVDTLYSILSIPSETILENAGSLYVPDSSKYPLGYDVVNEQEVDMIASGIIDPVKVIKESLINSVSVASTMLSAGALMVD